MVAPVDCIMSAHVLRRSPSPNLLEESNLRSSCGIWKTCRETWRFTRRTASGSSIQFYLSHVARTHSKLIVPFSDSPIILYIRSRFGKTREYFIVSHGLLGGRSCLQAEAGCCLYCLEPRCRVHVIQDRVQWVCWIHHSSSLVACLDAQSRYSTTAIQKEKPAHFSVFAWTLCAVNIKNLSWSLSINREIEL